ncbi:DNA/RNA helicase domain-containing protein [Sphingobacterium thalpophilum]|uniref:DNA/RNA helicase domain-containing protein n=1 Tax=Sphingobacterium thalpophilum TaxID=259 RepID=UPI003D95E845
MPKQFQIIPYTFDSQLEYTLLQQQRDYLSWPIVYFLQNKNDAYVGESTDVVTRMKAHLKTEKKQDFKSVSLILSDLFNKSATLDVESNLIRYIAADRQFHLRNGNLGISDHKFYQQKEVYWELFRDIWSELRSLGIARHSLEYLDNSDLFKYSPYKSLSRDQTDGLKLILHCLLDDQAKVSLIHGGAGTGKSVLAIFLFKLLKTDLKDFNRADFDESDEELFQLVEAVRQKYGDLEMGLVIPMRSFRKTISKVFRNINGLSSKMAIGPAEVANRKYDLLIVDEGHRLRRWKNLAAYYGTFRKVSRQLGFDELTCSELDWIELQSDRSIIFYDEFQSIKPSDIDAQRFIDLQLKSSTRIERLRSQFRVRGGAPYMNLIYGIFADNTTIPSRHFESIHYDFKLFDDVDEMVEAIKRKNEQDGLCRMVAGFAWKWISKHDRTRKDIIIGESQLQWNSVEVDWVNSPNAINEVGCIHTTQGYDLNYTGLIIGPELDYDFKTKSFVVDKNKYMDKNGKLTITDPTILKNYILNIYRTILFRGIQGTYVYVCNDNLRAYLSAFIKPHQTQGSESKKEILINDVRSENSIPFYDLAIAAGSFSELQQDAGGKYLHLDEYHDPQRYFACKVVGESMNKIIPNGSICLFDRYQGGSRNGLICLVESSSFEHSDFGANYTIKEYSSKKTITEEGWQHQEIILLPKSTDDSYSPIVLKDEETVDLQVIGVFRRVLY